VKAIIVCSQNGSLRHFILGMPPIFGFYPLTCKASKEISKMYLEYIYNSACPRKRKGLTKPNSPKI